MVDSEKEYGHKPARWVLIVLVSGLASLVLGNQLFFQITTFTRKGDQPVWHDLSQQKWDPNTATQAELELVPGMGPKLATNILEARKTKNIESLEDLGKIKGFGPQRVSLMGPWLQFPHAKEGNPEQGTNLFGASDVLKHEAKTYSPKRMDPNLASAEELETIPGIGPKLARKIISERQIKKYDSLEDLVRVNGIGPNNIEKLRTFLFVAP
jgi:competence protein ComEA